MSTDVIRSAAQTVGQLSESARTVLAALDQPGQRPNPHPCDPELAEELRSAGVASILGRGRVALRECPAARVAAAIANGIKAPDPADLGRQAADFVQRLLAATDHSPHGAAIMQLVRQHDSVATDRLADAVERHVRRSLLDALASLDWIEIAERWRARATQEVDPEDA